jgi:hypothetical protein
MICRKCRSEIPPEDVIEEVIRLVAAADRAKQKERVGPTPKKVTRRFLIEWLTTWRADHGVSDSGRPLKNRSTAQLQKLYEQAVAGGNYRVGRSWKE